MNRKKLFVAIITAVLMLYINSTVAYANSQSSKMEIKALIHKYESALNKSNAEEIIKLYAKDGIFMPSNKPTAIGSFQVEISYQHVFKDLDLLVAFHINEILIRNDLAIVRTSSDGEITYLKNNKTVKNNSRELFVMKHGAQGWKIYRYMFNENSEHK